MVFLKTPIFFQSNVKSVWFPKWFIPQVYCMMMCWTSKFFKQWTFHLKFFECLYNRWQLIQFFNVEQKLVEERFLLIINGVQANQFMLETIFWQLRQISWPKLEMKKLWLSCQKSFLIWLLANFNSCKINQIPQKDLNYIWQRHSTKQHLWLHTGITEIV